jgi:hypothetical protein
MGVLTRSKTEYIVDGSGKRVGVILDIKDYERLLEELEEYSLVKAYDEAMADREPAIPFEQAMEETERHRAKDADR